MSSCDCKNKLKTHDCGLDSCRQDAINNAVAYRKAQKATLSLIQAQIETMCCALRRCDSSTLADLERAAAILGAETSRECAYPLVIPSVTGYEAQLRGATMATGGTATTGLADVTNITNNTPPILFDIAGTFNINGTIIDLADTSLETARDVAESLLESIREFSCGLYSCVGINPVSYFRLSLATPVAPDDAVEVALFNPVVNDWTTENIPFDGTDYAAFAAAFNDAFEGRAEATVVQVNGDDRLEIFVEGGYNLRIEGPANVEWLNSEGENVRGEGVTWTPGANPNDYFELTGIVEVASNYEFLFTDLSESLNVPDTVVATATDELIASYCPTYQNVNTFVCNGVDFITLTAPAIPLNQIEAALEEFPTMDAGERAEFTTAICNLVGLLEAYLRTVKDELLNYALIEKSLLAFNAYCGLVSPAVCCSVKNKLKLKKAVAKANKEVKHHCGCAK